MTLHTSLASPPGDLRSLAGMCPNATLCVPSSSAPLRCTTTGLSLWCHSHRVWGYGLHCPTCPAGSFAQFDSIQLTSVAVRDSIVLCEEIAVLLAKDAIEPVPPAEMRQGFYSLYVIIPKKAGGLQPILDLRISNLALLKLPFEMLTQKLIIRCIQPQD